MEENKRIVKDLVQLSEYALSGSEADIRLFLARLVRDYRDEYPKLSKLVSDLLKKQYRSSRSYIREMSDAEPVSIAYADPVEHEKPVCLNGPVCCSGRIEPILTDDLKRQFTSLISEHQMKDRLYQAGLKPACTMIFVGEPGVGKTMSANWLSRELGLPLYTIDIAAVVSSFLGQTGNNLKAALDYAKQQSMVLLLDEIDALAKKRSDDTDVGEFKRVVAVLLHEIEHWPSESILIAATNHPKLVDPALWRRFDCELHFSLPSGDAVERAIQEFLAEDYRVFSEYTEIIKLMVEHSSYSDIERLMLRFRRALAVGSMTPLEIVTQAIPVEHNRTRRLSYAKQLLKTSKLSQHRISVLTGVSRDTLRKYKAQQRWEVND